MPPDGYPAFQYLQSVRVRNSSEKRRFAQAGRLLRIAASVPIRYRFLGTAIPSGSLNVTHNGEHPLGRHVFIDVEFLERTISPMAILQAV